MASWPPMYPALLALCEVLGLSPLTAALALSAGAFAACAFVGVRWIGIRTASASWGLVATLAFIVAPPLVFVSSLALTDMLFTAFTVAALASLDRWLDAPTRRRLLGCAALVAWASLTRYHGIVLAGTVAVMVLVYGHGTLMVRARAAAAITAIGLAPLALWITRNILATGTPTGPRIPSNYALAVGDGERLR